MTMNSFEFIQKAIIIYNNENLPTLDLSEAWWGIKIPVFFDYLNRQRKCPSGMVAFVTFVIKLDIVQKYRQIWLS
jgi:hypothetical protein